MNGAPLGRVSIAFWAILAAATFPFAVAGQEHVTAPNWSPPTNESVAASLENLEFREFLDESYVLYLQRFPEVVTKNGLARVLGMDESGVNDYTPPYREETERIVDTILAALHSYDRDLLPAQERVFYDAYSCLWEDVVAGRVFAFPPDVFDYYSAYPIQLFDVLETDHELLAVEDVEAFLHRASCIPSQLSQLQEEIDRLVSLGMVPQISLLRNCRASLNRTFARGSTNPLYQRLNRGMRTVEGLDSDARRTFLDRLLTLLSESIIPAYRDFSDYLSSLMNSAPSAGGWYRYSEGDAYYAFMLEHYAQVDSMLVALHEHAVIELDRLRDEIANASSEIGLPGFQDVSALLTDIRKLSQDYSGPSAIRSAFLAMIQRLEVRIPEAFNAFPSTPLEVVTRKGDFQTTPQSFDGLHAATFYVSSTYPNMHELDIAWVTCHETSPGHHLQLAISRELDLPFFVTVLQQPRPWSPDSTYIEGWARYCEHLADELRWYPQAELSHIRLLLEDYRWWFEVALETGIQALYWTEETARAFILDHYPSLMDYAVSDYIEDKQTSLGWDISAYALGPEHFLALRSVAEEALDDAFVLAEFHDVVLRNGILPMQVLTQVVEDYIETKLASQAADAAG